MFGLYIRSKPKNFSSKMIILSYFFFFKIWLTIVEWFVQNNGDDWWQFLHHLTSCLALRYFSISHWDATERLLCDPSNWSDLLKTTFSNYNTILCSWLVICNIFIVFSVRDEEVGWFYWTAFCRFSRPAAKWLLWRWNFQSGCEPSWAELRPLCL